jgi:hypothetical protein
MVITYALEDRAATYVLAFSLSRLAAGIYAILIRAWPFAGVETIWSVIAFRRWLRRRDLALTYTRVD